VNNADVKAQGEEKGTAAVARGGTCRAEVPFKEQEGRKVGQMRGEREGKCHRPCQIRRIPRAGIEHENSCPYVRRGELKTASGSEEGKEDRVKNSCFRGKRSEQRRPESNQKTNPTTPSKTGRKRLRRTLKGR